MQQIRSDGDTGMGADVAKKPRPMRGPAARQSGAALESEGWIPVSLFPEERARMGCRLARASLGKAGWA